MADQRFNRRDFLKLLSLTPAAYFLPKTHFLPADHEEVNQPNFIILVFDAWSASNMSLYGYPRKTTPFLEKLAEKAIVYHNHYAGGHWTYPGTTSLLTGVLPWLHRGYTMGTPFLEEYKQKNIFSLFTSHFRSAYSHNQIADGVLQRMIASIDEKKPRQELYLNENFWLSNIFGNDYDTASTAWVRAAKKFDDGYANSLFLSRLYNLLNTKIQKDILQDYPRGLPAVEKDNYFLLDTAINWISDQAKLLPEPFMGYYHLLPPHDPYTPTREFTNKFLNDGFKPVSKPDHPFALNLNLTKERVNRERWEYDEFILFVDSEINRLYNMLSASNSLDNTWLIITSDHGEMFERGIIRHIQPSFHDPQMRIPLLIFPPGLEERQDIYTPTSATDLIPTLLHLTGKNIPGWLEGELLPPYTPNPHPNRLIFSMDARFSAQKGPFTTGSVMLRQGEHKLTYLFGTEGLYEPLNGNPLYELYNLENDPEELNNIYNTQPEIAQTMLETLYDEMEKHGAR